MPKKLKDTQRLCEQQAENENTCGYFALNHAIHLFNPSLAPGGRMLRSKFATRPEMLAPKEFNEILAALGVNFATGSASPLHASLETGYYDVIIGRAVCRDKVNGEEAKDSGIHFLVLTDFKKGSGSDRSTVKVMDSCTGRITTEGLVEGSVGLTMNYNVGATTMRTLTINEGFGFIQSEAPGKHDERPACVVQ